MPELQPPRGGIDFESLPWNMNESDKASMVYLRTKGPDAAWGPEHYDSDKDSGAVCSAVKFGRKGFFFEQLLI